MGLLRPRISHAGFVYQGGDVCSQAIHSKCLARPETIADGTERTWVPEVERMLRIFTPRPILCLKMFAVYQYTQNATKVFFGARNQTDNADFYVFNFFAASSSAAILNITKGLVHDPQLTPWINGLIAQSANPYPPLLAVNNPVAGAEDLILLPDRVFVHPTAPLQLQAPQMLMNWTADMGQFLDWTIRGVSPEGIPYSYEFNRTVDLEPSKHGTAVRVSFHNRQKPGQWSAEIPLWSEARPSSVPPKTPGTWAIR